MSTMGNMTDNTTYTAPADAFSQSFVLLMHDGTPFNVSLSDLADYHYLMVRLGISRGATIGATVIMLIALLLLTKPEKRRSPLFYLNTVALLLNSIKQLLMALFLTGPFVHPYAIFAGDFSRIRGIDQSDSVAVPVLQTILLVTVLASLLIQVKVVAATAPDIARLILCCCCVLVALVAIGFQFAFMVVNCQNIVALRSGYTQYFQRLQKQTTGAVVAALLLFTAIFVAKLGYAILKRRRMGIRQFHPMQIVFIMGLQTMVVPTIIASLQFAPDLPEMNYWFLTLVVLSLPLSTLWASAAVDGTRSGSPSRAMIAGYANSSTAYTKSASSQRSRASFSCQGPRLDTSILAEGDSDSAGTRSIVAEKSWTVSRQEV